jgi:hypothetical protein
MWCKGNTQTVIVNLTVSCLIEYRHLTTWEKFFKVFLFSEYLFLDVPFLWFLSTFSSFSSHLYYWPLIINIRFCKIPIAWRGIRNKASGVRWSHNNNRKASTREGVYILDNRMNSMVLGIQVPMLLTTECMASIQQLASSLFMHT